MPRASRQRLQVEGAPRQWTIRGRRKGHQVAFGVIATSLNSAVGLASTKQMTMVRDVVLVTDAVSDRTAAIQAYQALQQKAA